MSEDIQPYGAKPDAGALRTNEFRELLAQSGMSQRQAADELEVDQRTVRYWASANPPPPKMAVYAMRHIALMKVLRAGVLTPEDVAEANRVAGERGVDELLRAYLQADSGADLVLVQTPRGTI